MRLLWRVALCFVALLFVSVAVAANLATLKVGNVEVVVTEDAAGAFTIEIKSGTTIAASAFIVDNPSRLVVDLPSGMGKGAPKYSINAGVFSTLRVGAHPDKTRLVFDLVDAQAPQVASSGPTATGMKITLRATSAVGKTAVAVAPSVAPPVPAAATPSAPPTAKPTAVSTPTPTATPKAAPSPTPTAKTSPTPLPTPTATRAAGVKTPPAVTPQAPATEATPTPEPIAPRTPRTLGELEAAATPTVKKGFFASLFERKKEEPTPTSRPPFSPEMESLLREVEVPAAESAPQKVIAMKGNASEAESKAAKLGLAAKGLDTKKMSGRSVMSLAYATRDNSPALAIALSESGDYTLTQTSSNSYLLVLVGAKLSGAHLGLPIFPPDVAEGFEVVKAVQEGNDVAVSIYLEGPSKLAPAFAEGTLWLQLLK